MSLRFSFPGQGSHYVGMGKDLLNHYEAVRRVYQEASKALGYDVAALSFYGPAEELDKTFRTQPCLMVRQLRQSVLWEDCVKTVFAAYASTFIEVGPGKVLSDLIRRIEPSARVFNVGNVETVTKVVSEFRTP